MLLTALLPLLPLALAVPTTPELSVSQWKDVQSNFLDSVRSYGLGSWSWNKAEEVMGELDIKNPFAGDESELTLWQQLKADPHSFSKLVKLIEFVETPIKYLDDKDLQLTFFAPNNDALTPPEHHGHHHHDHDHEDVSLQKLMADPSLTAISALLDSNPSFLGDDDDDEKKKHRKEIFRKIAGKVLQYHGLPKAYTAAELAQNSTFATALKAEDGSFGGLHRRIKVTKNLVPPSLTLNFYAKVLTSDKKARNGYLHTLNHPLLPPGSILEEVFLFPDTFSTLTSSIQKVGGEHFYSWGYDRNASSPGKPKFSGTGLATTFNPTNVAFGLLPPKLKFYLFSPFGEKALAKVLMYHYVPKTLLLSELLYTEGKKGDFVDEIAAMEYFNLSDDPSFHKELEIPTALPNATIKVVIDKTKFLPIEGAVKTTIKVNDEPVEVIDVPARNGASHVIGKLLVPPHHHHDHEGEDISSLDTWQNWEQWLPTWANEE